MIKIIISPAKKMNVADDFPVEVTRPKFLEDARQLMDHLKGLTYEEQKRLWQCNDKIAGENAARLRDMDLTRRLSPAVIAYEGIQYQTMAPAVMEQKALDYLGEHLYILSGFYGLLRAFDGVTPYRLEMQAKLEWDRGNLYQFWGDRLYRALAEPGDVIVNLASKEYSKAVEPWLTPETAMVTCVFGELGGTSAKPGVRVKATAAKMARGAMVRYLAEHGVTEPEQMKQFDWGGYRFVEELSDERTYVFGVL